MDGAGIGLGNKSDPYVKVSLVMRKYQTNRFNERPCIVIPGDCDGEQAEDEGVRQWQEPRL